MPPRQPPDPLSPPPPRPPRDDGAPPSEHVEHHEPPEGEVLAAATRLAAAIGVSAPVLARAATDGTSLFTIEEAEKLVRRMDRLAAMLRNVGRRRRRHDR